MNLSYPMSLGGLRIFRTLILFLALGGWSHAQFPSILIQPDIRVFTVLGALRAAGFDEGSLSLHPAGLPIAREFQNLPDGLKVRLKEFYDSHRRGENPQQGLTKYISLAFVIDGPPEFKPLLAAGRMPPDAESVAGLTSLLGEFYSTARVESVWSRHKHLHDRAVLDYRPLINQMILTTDGYLRMRSGAYRGRQLVLVPDYLVPPNTFNARTYQSSYYFLFGPSKPPKTSEIRHQYLHFLLDPFPARYPLPAEQSEALGEIMLVESQAPERIKGNLQEMVTESLIKAVEMRLDRFSEQEAEASLNEAIRSGALLARYFFTALQRFEREIEGFQVYYRTLLSELDVSEVRAAQQVALSSAPRFPSTPPPPTEVERLLRQAKSSLGGDQLARAVELFNLVLNRHDPDNGEAFYGLGIVAINRRDKESARDFFGRSLASETCPASVKVWAHIYLGRLYDLEDNREEALVQYQAAVALGDDTGGAQAMAQRGLEEPFNPTPATP
jgi:tetratricopeptide (TPR) repeat protein